jgi:hypothetical protein
MPDTSGRLGKLGAVEAEGCGRQRVATVDIRRDGIGHGRKRIGPPASQHARESIPVAHHPRRVSGPIIALNQDQEAEAGSGSMRHAPCLLRRRSGSKSPP